MAEAATLPSTSTAQEDRSFWWRRLHSLTGVLPVGGYLCYHIFENLSALRGPAAYDEMVNKVNTMLPRMYFHVVELALIIGPLMFHALYGLYIASTGKANVSRYAYGSSWAYWGQRVSGYLAFLYILLHVGTLRVVVTMLGSHLAAYPGPTEGGLNLVTYNDVAAHLGNPAHRFVDSVLAGNHIFAAYVVGTLASIWHFTNGLNGFAWTWGIAVGRVAQRRVRFIAWGLFVLLAAATLNILFQMRFGS